MSGNANSKVSSPAAGSPGGPIPITKQIQGITGGPTDPCYGSTSFQVSYDGQVTNVMGLVTDTIKDEIILSLKALQRLGIVHEEYPRSQWSVTKKATLDTDVNEMDLAQELELLKEKYREVFDHESELKIMNGTPVKIELKDDVIIKPMHVNVPRRVAYAQEKASKDELDRLVRLGVLEYVPGSSQWVSPMTFAMKPDGTMRLVGDYVHLNKYVKRPIHPFKCAKDIINAIDPKAKWFAVMDCKAGYWQLELDSQSSWLTCFLTQWGVYRYLRTPMGLVSSGDLFCQRTDMALTGLPGMEKLVDDILIMGATKKELVERMEKVIKRCQEHKITLNDKKIQVGQSVKFGGHVITSEGSSPDPDKVRAIKDFPKPTNVTDVRSFLG